MATPHYDEDGNRVTAGTAVRVTDLNMPFWSLVKLLVKIALAAIPALLILALIGGFLVALLYGITGRS